MDSIKIKTKDNKVYFCLRRSNKNEKGIGIDKIFTIKRK